MAASMNQFWLGGNYQAPMPGYQADPNARPVFFDQTSANNYAAMNTPFGGQAAPAPVHVANPTLGNNQNMPVTAWSNPAPAAQPAPQPQPAAPAPGGGGDLLSQLLAQAQAYDPSAQINQAFDLQTKQGLESMGMDWEDNLAARGVNPGAATGQDLKSRLSAQLLAPIAAQRASALAGAQGDKFNRLQSIYGLQQQQQSLAQAQAWQQKQFEWQQQQDAKDREWQRIQFDFNKSQAEKDAEWRNKQQGWAEEDRNRALNPQAANPYGGPGQAPQQQAPVTFFDLIAGNPAYGGAQGGGQQSQAPAYPTTSTGMPMGGGAGLGSYNSGQGPESSGLNPDGTWRRPQSQPINGASRPTSFEQPEQPRQPQGQQPQGGAGGFSGPSGTPNFSPGAAAAGAAGITSWGAGTTTHPAPAPGMVTRPGTTPSSLFGQNQAQRNARW